jgi:hypothetical protein
MGQLAPQEMTLQVKTHKCARIAKINVVQESVLKTRQSKLNKIYSIKTGAKITK